MSHDHGSQWSPRGQLSGLAQTGVTGIRHHRLKAPPWWTLVSFVVGIALNIITGAGMVNSTDAYGYSSPAPGPLSIVGYILLAIWGLAIIVPSLALTVRRLHDVNMSGWMILLGLIPFVGGVIVGLSTAAVAADRFFTVTSLFFLMEKFCRAPQSSCRASSRPRPPHGRAGVGFICRKNTSARASSGTRPRDVLAPEPFTPWLCGL